MKWFNNLKMRTKLLASFAVMAFIVILLGVVSIRGIGITKMKQGMETLYADRLVPAIDLGKIG
ncbi:MCP four helix bundle domain-containing protein, partial [Dissulfurispira sp.]|uniref:MCP four helix bundle domain-containing protein n=1 Tax=Dissulfurispira sp. TaxID=2817609 RepID=UPI002FD8E2A2